MSMQWLTIEDAKKIFDLYSADFADGWSQKMLCDGFLTGRFLALGVNKQEKLVGVITCSTTMFDADIESVFVDKNFRKQGIASMLITGLEKELIKSNIEKIFLEVRNSNIQAQNLYSKHGFKKISQRKNYYSDGEDAVIMAKELKNRKESC